MAMGSTYDCSNCSFSVMVWDDSNQFYYDEKGVKQYAYHPDHDLLELCVGSDPSMFCTACGHQFIHDSDRPSSACPVCHSPETVENGNMEGRHCPKCRVGTLKLDPERFAIS